MKKILFIHHWNSIGGSGISLFNTWKSLKEEYDVTTYIPDSSSDFLEFLESKGLHPKTYSFTCGQVPYYSGGSNPLKPGFWFLIVNAVMQMSYWRRIIAAEAPDLIIVNSKVLCWMGSLFKNIKSICFVRETIEGNSSNILNKWMKSMLENFTAVSFLSEYDMNQTGLKKAHSVVVPDFLYLDDYADKCGRDYACQQLMIDAQSFNIAFVGGIDQLKGIDIVVRAMQILKDEDISLIVAGNDIGIITSDRSVNPLVRLRRKKSLKFSDSIKSFILKEGLSDRIKLVGVQSDMSKLFSASDLLVFPMKRPHQARPAFEIGAQRKPVIISDFPNIREFVQDNTNGYTFESGNPESLATAILKLKNDRATLKRLGDSNYEFTLKYHTESYAMSILKNMINEIL